jgi:uncharacterized membrane protein
MGETTRSRKRQANTSKIYSSEQRRSVESDSPCERSIEAIAQLEHAAYNARSQMDHCAVAITRVASSGIAILLHLIWFVFWLVANLHLIPGITPFDPFPFNLLTTVVSLEAIFLTLFVLISQNRMSQESDKRAHLSLQVNLLAEKESTMILKMLQEISSQLGVRGPIKEDLQDLVKETKIAELAEKLEGALSPQ